MAELLLLIIRRSYNEPLNYFAWKNVIDKAKQVQIKIKMTNFQTKKIFFSLKLIVFFYYFDILKKKDSQT